MAAVTTIRSNWLTPGGMSKTVPEHHLDIVAAEPLQPYPGGIREGAEALDRQHLARKP